MKNEGWLKALLPLSVALGFIGLWTVAWRLHFFHESAFPSPLAVLKAFVSEMRGGRILMDLVTSLFRVFAGFGLAVIMGVPAGLFLGLKATARAAFLPTVNFFRNLSPLAWIPFAILWFGV